MITYTRTTHDDDDKRFKPTTDTDHPHQTNEQDHSEDVLDARKVNTKNRAELPRLWNTNSNSNSEKYNLYDAVSHAEKAV